MWVSRRACVKNVLYYSSRPSTSILLSLLLPSINHTTSLLFIFAPSTLAHQFLKPSALV